MPLIQIQKAVVAFGGPPVLDAVDLVLERGERLALVGRNGAGKSTLLQLIQGTLDVDHGSVVREAGLRVASLSQHVPDGLEGTVLELTLAGTGMSVHAAEAAISRVGLEPTDGVAPLSAGLKRRALLARALVTDPDVLLLDEPTNHLDIESIRWLEDFLRRQNRTLLFVTHDRAFLRGLSTGILDLDRGRLTRYPPDYDAYVERKQAELSVEDRGNRQFDKRLAEEEVWIRRGVRERRKRNIGRVGRLEAMRVDRQVRRDRSAAVRMEAASAAPSGRIVLRAEDVHYAWDGVPMVTGLSTEIQRGDRVGVIGPNGSGKTTLLRLLLGELQPDAGRVRLGANLEIAYFDQLHATLDDDLSAAENVGGGDQTIRVNGKDRHVVSYLADFLFSADEARGGIRHFSGGERNRLLLARLFCRPSNVLVLDEPTNDLDVETLEVLEDLLGEYDGTILVVSHDRELLDHVVTSTLVLEGGGTVGSYVGGYSDWLAQRGELAAAPARSKRSKGLRPQPKRPAAPLSREEQQALRSLPAHIEKLEQGQAKLHAMLADPEFLKGPGERTAAAKERLREFEAAIAKAYARWQSLEQKQGSP